MPVDPNEPTYCLCHQVSYGEMIGCDNPDVSVRAGLALGTFGWEDLGLGTLGRTWIWDTQVGGLSSGDPGGEPGPSADCLLLCSAQLSGFTLPVWT